MRTKQGTLRGYTSDGFVAHQGCRGYVVLRDDWVECDAAVEAPYLTPKEAKRGVRVLHDAHVWWCTPDSVKGRLCAHCARAWHAAVLAFAKDALSGE